MTAKNVMMPDGTEYRGDDVICEECDKPVSGHACATTSGGSSGTGTVVATRSTGPRKDPKDRPSCPHCKGAIHFSMPGVLQNVECMLRQMYVDKGVIADPFARLPIGGIETMRELVEWASTLKEPLAYGRMDSAAGGAGTYSAIRPKADPSEKKPRAKKQQAAGAGEKIEDIAKGVGPTATPVGPTATTSREDRRQKLRRQPRVVTPPPPSVQDVQAERDERQARRRAILLGTGTR